MTDPDTLRAMVERHDPRIVAVDALVEAIDAALEALPKQASDDYGEPLRVRKLRRGDVAEAMDLALRSLPQLDIGYGEQTLGKGWPESYEPGQNKDVDDFEQLVYPTAFMVFAAQVGAQLHVGFGFSASRKPSLGTCFASLAPWRKNSSEKTLRKKLERFASEGAQVSCSLETARLWRELRELQQGDPEAQVAADPPSDKQLGFIASLRRRKGLADDEAFADFMQPLAGVRNLPALEKAAASLLIDSLLELPDVESAPRPRAKSKPAAKPKPAKPKQKGSSTKLAWEGELVAVQPRIKLSTERGEEQHSYQGFVLYVRGALEGEDAERVIAVGIGKAAQAKHAFRKGDRASGKGVPIGAGSVEAAELYKASALKVLERGEVQGAEPPWFGPPPELPDYRERGHRPLNRAAYEGACAGCIWACDMPCDDELEPQCYGPRDCHLYESLEDAPF